MPLCYEHFTFDVSEIMQRKTLYSVKESANVYFAFSYALGCWTEMVCFHKIPFLLPLLGFLQNSYVSMTLKKAALASEQFFYG